MRKTCRLAAEVLEFIGPKVRPGATTGELDKLCHDFIVEHGAYPSPLNYRPRFSNQRYPKSICASVNDVVCHGVPGRRVLSEGDIVNLDITTYLEGYHGDTSATFFVVLLMVGIAALGTLAAWRGRAYLMLAVFVFSFFPMGLYLAGRWEIQRYSEVTDSTGAAYAWQADRNRAEFGMGFRFTRNVTARAVYQENVELGPRPDGDGTSYGLAAAQLTVGF